MIFVHPYLLLLLIFVLLFFIIWTFLQYRSKKRLARIIPTSQWHSVIPGLSYKRRSASVVCFCLALCCIIFAMGQPKYGYKIVEQSRKGINILIALDTSISMQAKDIFPNRFHTAKKEIKGLINLLKEDHIGLLLFAGKSFIQCPLTSDYNAFSMFLDNSTIGSINSPGSDLAQSIKTARLTFQNHKNSQNILVIFTDGESYVNDPIASAKLAVKENVKIFTVGVGQTKGEPIPIYDEQNQVIGYKKNKQNELVFSKLDEQTLKEITELSQTQYYHLNGSNSIYNDLYKEISLIEKRYLDSKVQKNHIHRYQIFCFFALILLLLGLSIKQTKS